MEWQLAILLALVSLIIIGFIYFDAKRRSKARKERIERDLYQERLAKSRDTGGFDDDGIGNVRVVGDSDAAKEPTSSDEFYESEPETELETGLETENDLSSAKEKILREEAAFSADNQSQSGQDEFITENKSSDVEQNNNDLNETFTEQSVTEPDDVEQSVVEPTISESDIPVLDDALFEFTKESLKKDSVSTEETAAQSKKEPSIEQPQQTSLFDEPENEPAVEVEPELIFSLFVVSSQERPFQGPELIQTLVEQGMRHGDMDIFHRHAQANGRGAVQFSLANAFEPGIFDLKKVDDLETKGLALFMALPGPKKPMKAYDLMVKTAQGITQELGGFVLDSSKSNFSKQIESHHREQIVEFERKQLLNK